MRPGSTSRGMDMLPSRTHRPPGFAPSPSNQPGTRDVASWRAWRPKPVKKRVRKRTAGAERKAPKRATAARRPAPRADLGAPVDGFFAKQPAHLRPVLDNMRALIEEAAPDA